MKIKCANCGTELEIEIAGKPEPFNCPSCGEFNDAPESGAKHLTLAGNVAYPSRNRPVIAWPLLLSSLAILFGALWLIFGGPESFFPAVAMIIIGLLSSIVFWLRGIYTRLDKR